MDVGSVEKEERGAIWCLTEAGRANIAFGVEIGVGVVVP